jgi:hypothetical protein
MDGRTDGWTNFGDNNALGELGLLSRKQNVALSSLSLSVSLSVSGLGRETFGPPPPSWRPCRRQVTVIHVV